MAHDRTDICQGPHRGLVTDDVEFASRYESQAFQPTDWLGAELTVDRHYANATLARRGRLTRKG